MKSCKAIGIGLLIAVTAAALSDQSLRTLAQTKPSVSPREPGTGVPPRKEIAPTKQAGVSENRNTAGLVTGSPESTDFAIAQEIATTLLSGQETGPHGELALRVVPMVGNGGIRDIMDVLTAAGADMAIAPVVLVDRLRDAGTVGDIRNKLVYIALLFPEEFHVLARSDVGSLSDLAGKIVNLGQDGSGGAVLGREVLNRLGIRIAEVNIGPDLALDGMRKGQIAATLLVSGKPVDFITRNAQPDGFRLLSIPYSSELQQHFLPSTLSNADYPSIVNPGERIDTIAMTSALFAYNWPNGSERFRLLEFFVQTLFSRFSEFLGGAHHAKWHEVNLAATLPGWKRFRPAERWLERQPVSESQEELRSEFERFLTQNRITDLSDRERLFQQFLHWRERRRGR